MSLWSTCILKYESPYFSSYESEILERLAVLPCLICPSLKVESLHNFCLSLFQPLSSSLETASKKQRIRAALVLPRRFIFSCSFPAAPWCVRVVHRRHRKRTSSLILVMIRWSPSFFSAGAQLNRPLFFRPCARPATIFLVSTTAKMQYYVFGELILCMSLI